MTAQAADVMAKDAAGPSMPAGDGLLSPAAAYQRDMILATGLTLADQLDPSVGALVRDLVDKIRNRPFRIAVLGQMKAGKTTVVNALAAQPGLLPSDVNPWTVAVTRLHLGQTSDDGSAGVFRFFATDEWAEIASGGRVSALQKQLVPDVELDGLRAQVETVQAQARQRLGDDYARLLGQSHRHREVTSELISRYVAALDGSGDAERPIFSDITRSADIFLAESPFGLPVTLADTPGTNDPFLVRDEITLQCLDEMDAAIVVLSARQALSMADIALLRMLRGLRKDRLIVVVNRCDELDEPAAHAPIVAQHVNRLLDREFGRSIEVLTFSAAWATIALSADAAVRSAALDGGLAGSLIAKGAATRDEVNRWRSMPGSIAPERWREAVLTAAGMPPLHQALGRLLADSGLGGMIAQTLKTLSVIAEQQEGLARRDLSQLEETLKGAQSDVLSGGFELERLQTAIERLDGTMVKLERIASERTAEIEQTQRQGLDRLNQHLKQVVDDFLDKERANFILALDQQTTTKPVRFEVGKLRKELEQAFLSEYRALYQHIVNIQLAASQHFRRVVNDELPSTNLDIHVNVVSNSFVYPSLRALGRVSAFDVDPKLWGRWRKAKRSLKEAAEAFEQILRGEFEDIASELAGVAEHEIMGSASSLQRRLNLTIMDAVNSARQRRAELLDRLAALEAQREPKAQERLLEDQLERLTAARERLRRVDNLARTLRAATLPDDAEVVRAAAGS